MSQQDHFQNPTYDKAFAAFLSHTNEKEVLFAEIKRVVENLKATSLLDVGAGNGDLAIPLSQLVNVYLAVEQKSTYAARLKEAGLRMVENVFPVKIEGLFDVVLACHSIPWEKERETNDWKNFLQGCWDCVKKEGVLLAVTYDDEESDWHDLVRACGLRDNTVSSGDGRLKKLELFLADLGPVTKSTVTTYVRAHTLPDTAMALSFVYSGGAANREREFSRATPEIYKHLRAAYEKKEGFQFPFQHIFLNVQK